MIAKNHPARPSAKSGPARPLPPATRAPKPTKHRIYLVDDHPMTRVGLAANINQQSDMEICGEAGTPAEAISGLVKLKPDLMVTDLTMPGRSGIEFLKDVHAMQPKLLILVLSMHDELLFARRALQAGARGYLMKDAGVVRMLEGIRQVLAGRVHVSPKLAEQMLDALTDRHPRGSTSPIAKLSDREFEVFQLLGSGKSTKEIAEALHLSPKTVDVHRGHIKEKLQLKDSASLFHHAVRWVESQATPGQRT